VPASAADVIVVGGGPGGSTLAWALAQRGIDVVVLERMQFPREKVCGDYVDPRGLRILERMGCLDVLQRYGPLPVTHSAAFVGSEQCYSAKIPFYGVTDGLSAHGYVIPRDVLDDVMLGAAERAGATVHQGTLVTEATAGTKRAVVEAKRGGRRHVFRSRLLVGADGANSVVGTTAGALVDDPRHTVVAQRAYATGVEGDLGEVVLFFDEPLFPGYGWMFPIAGGRVNVGVGLLSETRRRLDVSVPQLFGDFVERLRHIHPRCENLELCSAPLGGIVRTYGGAGPNHFDGGLLVGDAGSFVDPMTGEGITPAAESALLAAPVLEAALDAGRFDAAQLSAYERAFRAYFDPSMSFLDVCAAVMRNRSLAGSWLTALARGCELGQSNAEFARVGGSYFGGIDVRPFGILGEIWGRIAVDVALAWPRSLFGLGQSRGSRATGVGDLVDWQAAWLSSFVADPVWHTRWLMDVQRKSTRLVSTLRSGGPDPRAAGLLSP
jgi:geranylgeranyl reductase family protein